MTDLTDFADVPTHDPPKLRRKRIVETPIEGKIAGFVCRELNRETDPIAYSTLRGTSHYYRKGDGWAISDAILTNLERIGASLIFVHDGVTNSDDVYEFRASDYYRAGESVPESHLEDERDPQTYIPKDEALHTWEGHAGDLFTQEFEVALDRINEGRY